jgi:hypothetical protein
MISGVGLLAFAIDRSPLSANIRVWQHNTSRLSVAALYPWLADIWYDNIAARRDDGARRLDRRRWAEARSLQRSRGDNASALNAFRRFRRQLFLTRLVGAARTRELYFTGRRGGLRWCRGSEAREIEKIPLLERFIPLLERKIPLIARQRNYPGRSFQNNDLGASIAPRKGPKSGFPGKFPAKQGNGRFNSQCPESSAAPG